MIKRHTLLLALLCLPVAAQVTNDLVITKKTSTGYDKIVLSPNSNNLITFDGSNGLTTLPRSTFQGLDADLTDIAALSPSHGSILSRGASGWTVLSPGPGGQYLVTNGGGADPTWASLSPGLDALGSTRGSVLFRGSTGWGTLSPGTNGQVLTSSGTGADPTWTTITAGVSLSGTNQWTGQQSFNTASTTGAINVNPTWNSLGTVFAGIHMRVTDTSSSASSSLIDLGYGSTSVWKVTRAGNAMLNLPTSAGPRVDLYGFAGGGFSFGYGTSMGITGGGGTTTALRLDNGGNPIFVAAGNTATIAVNPTAVSISLGSALSSMDVVLSRAAAARLALNGSSGGASLQMTEMTAPSAPAANSALLYLDDDGSGKTRLMIRFATGAAQVLAIEP